MRSFCRKTHVHKILRFRGGGFWGGGKCRFYFYGREDFSEFHPLNLGVGRPENTVKQGVSDTPHPKFRGEMAPPKFRGYGLTGAPLVGFYLNLHQGMEDQGVAALSLAPTGSFARATARRFTSCPYLRLRGREKR